MLPLPLATPQRLTLAVGFFVASEIAFWLGFLLLGPAMLERWRRLRQQGRSALLLGEVFDEAVV